MTPRAEPAAQPRRAAPASLSALFLGFLQVSLLGFGGGLVWARRLAVEQRGWLSEAEFADVVTLCQLLPGPNVVGIAVCVGTKLRGSAGALAALSGFLLLPGAVGFAAGAVYLGHARLPVLQGILGGVAAVAAGLMTATGIRLLQPYRGHPVALLFAALAFAGLVLAKLPLVALLLGLAPLSIGAAAMCPAGRR